MEKKDIRRYIRQLKQSYSEQEKRKMSEIIWQQVELLPCFKKACLIVAYWSMEDEVYTPAFIRKWKAEKRFLLPCVKGEELEFRYFDGEEKLYPGEGFAIPEPVGEVFTAYEQMEMVIVPGVAFDAQGNRLGRGKGYYDKFLKRCPSALKIGVCFPFQLIENVPIDEYDVKMDMVIY